MMGSALDLLDDLELLALDSFLFDLQSEEGLGTDHEGSTPPEEAESEADAADAPPQEEVADPPAEELELSSVEPLVNSVGTRAAGPDHEGFEPPAPPEPELLDFLDLAGFDPPEPPPEEPEFLDVLM